MLKQISASTLYSDLDCFESPVEKPTQPTFPAFATSETRHIWKKTQVLQNVLKMLEFSQVQNLELSSLARITLQIPEVKRPDSLLTTSCVSVDVECKLVEGIIHSPSQKLILACRGYEDCKLNECQYLHVQGKIGSLLKSPPSSSLQSQEPTSLPESKFETVLNMIPRIAAWKKHQKHKIWCIFHQKTDPNAKLKRVGINIIREIRRLALAHAVTIVYYIHDMIVTPQSAQDMMQDRKLLWFAFDSARFWQNILAHYLQPTFSRPTPQELLHEVKWRAQDGIVNFKKQMSDPITMFLRLPIYSLIREERIGAKSYSVHYTEITPVSNQASFDENMFNKTILKNVTVQKSPVSSLNKPDETSKLAKFLTQG